MCRVRDAVMPVHALYAPRPSLTSEARQEEASHLSEQRPRSVPSLVPRQVRRHDEVRRPEGHKPEVRLSPADFRTLLVAVPEDCAAGEGTCRIDRDHGNPFACRDLS